jgi:NADPH:quinone reductase-like Zn-dependent oxidoreductase
VAFARALVPMLATRPIGPHQLVPQPRGSLGALAPVAVDPDAPLVPGAVGVRVEAVGLNFRDVLNVSTGLSCDMGMAGCQG